MNRTERTKMVKAMEFIMRQVNDEEILLGPWLSLGVADGDIDYGDLSVTQDDVESLEYYTDDKCFGELMDLFLSCMKRAYYSGGLFCDGLANEVRKGG